MAKIYPFALLVGAAAFGYFWLGGQGRPPGPAQQQAKEKAGPPAGQQIVPAKTSTALAAKKPGGAQNPPDAQKAASQPVDQFSQSTASPERQFMALTVKTINKALLSADEARQFAALVDSNAFQRQVEATLAEQRHQRFDFDREKSRMELISSLDTVRKYGSDATKAWYAKLLKDRIFSKDYLDKADIKYRRSLAGDKVEYLRLLRQADPEQFQQVKEAIHESGDKLLVYVLGKV